VTKLEVAMGQDVGFFAQTDTQECPGGEIRVGVLDPAFPERLVDRGRGARDPTYRGVATFGSDCTSNFSDACVAAKQNFLAGEAEQEEVDLSCGASGAAIAGIADQALVTFLGLPVSAARCPVDTEVFAMGLLQGRGDLSGDFYWSNPTSDGVPDTLGNTAGGAAPAVLAIADAGFLVGFGSDSGKVRLTWVPRQPPAPKNDGLTCGEEDLLCDDREAFSTAPLLGVLQLGELGSLGQFDGVRLASLELGEGIFALAVTWVEGCVRDADASFDGFAQIAVLEIDEESAQLTPVGDPVSLGPVGRPPMPIASDTPFVTPGFFRTVEGETEDPGDPLAPVPTLESVEGGMGFYVLLGDRRAVRLLVFDGQLLDPEEEIAVPSEARRHLSPDTPGAFLAFDPAGDRIVRAAISCE
jgi:hypothetical protein